MPYPFAVLTDVFTFICFLHADDIRPRGPRRLPPLALAGINAQFAVADHVELAPRAARERTSGARCRRARSWCARTISRRWFAACSGGGWLRASRFRCRASAQPGDDSTEPAWRISISLCNCAINFPT